MFETEGFASPTMDAAEKAKEWTIEQLEVLISEELSRGEADVDAHVQFSAMQLQIIKDQITKATVHTLTEIAMAQGAQGRADMVDGGVLVIVSRCFALFKPPNVHALALNMLHALMNGRLSEQDIGHDGDFMGFYSEIKEFNAQAERDPDMPSLLQFERLSVLERRKAHIIAAYVRTCTLVYHRGRSVGSPVNRKVIVSRVPITKDVISSILLADLEDGELGKDGEAAAPLAHVAKSKGKRTV